MVPHVNYLMPGVQRNSCRKPPGRAAVAEGSTTVHNEAPRLDGHSAAELAGQDLSLCLHDIHLHEPK